MAAGHTERPQSLALFDNFYKCVYDLFKSEGKQCQNILISIERNLKDISFLDNIWK